MKALDCASSIYESQIDRAPYIYDQCFHQFMVGELPSFLEVMINHKLSMSSYDWYINVYIKKVYGLRKEGT